MNILNNIQSDRSSLENKPKKTNRRSHRGDQKVGYDDPEGPSSRELGTLSYTISKFKS